MPEQHRSCLAFSTVQASQGAREVVPVDLRKRFKYSVRPRAVIDHSYFEQRGTAWNILCVIRACIKYADKKSTPFMAEEKTSQKNCLFLRGINIQIELSRSHIGLSFPGAHTLGACSRTHTHTVREPTGDG